MTVIFTIAGLHPESGGPSHSVPALCQALARDGVAVGIVSLDYGRKFGKPLNPAGSTDILSVKVEQASSLSPTAVTSNVPLPSFISYLPSAIGSVQTTLVDCSSALGRRAQWTPRFKRALRERCIAAGAHIIHDTGLWLLTNHAASAIGEKLNLPRIVSPRGMLTGWALRHKGWRKRIAWTLYQRRDLRTAHVLHATSLAEVADFRNAGLTQPVAMIPNGVELPALFASDGERAGVRCAESPGAQPSTLNSQTRTALFLGRIHPIKGLLDLIKAWALVRPHGWHFIIAGRDERGYASELKAEIRNLKLEADFEFVGPVEGERKWKLHQQVDLFVLPSHSENFGVVVAEALACGVPVLTTRGTPWKDLETHGCGWWAENGPEPLATALREALSRTDEERREMGRRGRKLIEQKYSWSGLAAQMRAVYRWMLGEGEKPGCIIKDGR